MRSVLWFAALGSCSDYDIKSQPATATGSTTTTTSTTPPVCDPALPAPYSVTPEPPCRGEPVVGAFDPEVAWTWTDNPISPGYQELMSTPVVANLTDDDGDGKIDGNDTPDVVFTAFIGGSYASPGAVVALSGLDGSTLWSVTDANGVHPYGAGGVAVADLEGAGQPSVLVASDTGLLCLDAAGAFRWNAAVQPYAFGFPAVGDLEGDGLADIAFGPSVVAHDGTVRWVGTAGTGYWLSYLVDLDDDGSEELVAGGTVYDATGTPRWSDGTDSWSGVADLNLDGVPEVIRVGGGAVSAVGALDGAPRWSFPLVDGGGGPPTLADFDGDGFPEVGVASRSFYRVIDTDGTELWEAAIQDYSSSVTGSSVFDFEGDGAAEVVYADEQTLWVYDGATGAVELQWDPHASGTLYEYPVIVDLDRDGSADIVTASNDYAFTGSRGITVMRSASRSWAAARPVWNQHAYFISNVGDDGSIPAHPTPNWSRWNSFRAGNSETAVGLDQPNLRPGPPQTCLDECGDGHVLVWVPVENTGVVPAVDVGLTLSDGSTVLATATIPQVDPGAAVYAGPFTIARDALAGGAVIATVDPEGLITECHEDDDQFALSIDPCP